MCVCVWVCVCVSVCVCIFSRRGFPCCMYVHVCERVSIYVLFVCDGVGGRWWGGECVGVFLLVCGLWCFVVVLVCGCLCVCVCVCVCECVSVCVSVCVV